MQDEENEKENDDIEMPEEQEQERKPQLNRLGLPKVTPRNIGQAAKRFFNIGETLKGVFKGDKASIMMLKYQLIFYGVVIIAVVSAILILEIATSASDSSDDEITRVMSTNTTINEDGSITQSGSSADQATLEAEKLYQEKGSLLLATEEQLTNINKAFIDDLKGKNATFYDALSIKYSGRISATIANKIIHFVENNTEAEEKETEQITDTIQTISGEASLKDERTIYEHILRTEKYNFNNIIWKSYDKANGWINTPLTLDSSSKLKYPTIDTGAEGYQDQDLQFFISKTSPYLQLWYIPFDLVSANQSTGTGEVGTKNTKFAYEILASAYSEIKVDRYKLETLNRNTNYRVYDKTTNTVETIRTCAKYEKTTARKVGEECTKQDYEKGYCKDYVIPKFDGSVWSNDKKFIEVYCTDTDLAKIKYPGDKERVKKWCDSAKWDYGVLARNVTTGRIEKTFCFDTLNPYSNEEKDIREETEEGVVNENKYRWSYIIDTAKTFDTITLNDYEFEAYYEYDRTNFDNYINKIGDYQNMTAENYQSSEQTNSKADSYGSSHEEYYVDSGVKEVATGSGKDTSWNASNVKNVESGFKMVANTKESYVVKKTEQVIKNGHTYKDVYVWNDKLNFKDYTSGIYNIDSVKDVTGDDLSSQETSYYNNLYKTGKLNLIDIMNSDYNLYKNYLRDTKETENKGYDRGYLNLSYTVLKQHVQEFLSKRKMSNLAYGWSLGIDKNAAGSLSGLGLGDVASIEATATLAEWGNVTYPISQADRANSNFDDAYFDGVSYGYEGHNGIDISYNYSASDGSLCSDYSHVRFCPYNRGPAIYSVFTGTIAEVGYSGYNIQFGNPSNYPVKSKPTKEGTLTINDTSGWGSYVKVTDASGKAVIYAHLFPDKDHFEKLSQMIGQPVNAGDFIGYMGNTGNSGGLHLHIEFATALNKIGNGNKNSIYTHEILKAIM